MGSMTAELKQCPYGCVFQLKPLVEGFYTQQLCRPPLLFGKSLPSHDDGQDFSDSRFVYKCQYAGEHCFCHQHYSGRLPKTTRLAFSWTLSVYSSKVLKRGTLMNDAQVRAFAEGYQDLIGGYHVSELR